MFSIYIISTLAGIVLTTTFPNKNWGLHMKKNQRFRLALLQHGTRGHSLTVTIFVMIMLPSLIVFGVLAAYFANIMATVICGLTLGLTLAYAFSCLAPYIAWRILCD